MLNDDDDDGARAAARARLAARAAHGEGGMAAQAAAEAAVEAVATGDANALSSLDANALSSLHARTPGATISKAPSNAEGAQKRKHIISPPMKVHRRKNDSGAPGVNVARAARDLCGDLGEPKESLMRRAVDVIGVVAANDLAIEVGAIEGAGGQMTTDGTRRRTPGGVFWALLKARAAKEDWDCIFEEEKEAARERCRRRRRAQSANGSPEGTPSGAALNGGGLLSGRFAAALSGLGADASASATTAKTPFATAGAAVVAAGVDDAPARPSMAERLSGVSATAKAFTPAAKGAKVATPGSWAARTAAHTPAMRRARSAPAAALAAAAPAKNDEKADEDAFAVTTPDNDPAAANATPGGTYAARARAAAAAEAEAQAAAQVRARAAKIVAANAAAKKKLAPAPAVAVADDAAEAPVASFSAPAPAPAWGVSFASVLRAV